MKKFIAEFKEFALRGNVMDMAIGMIIGGAFTSIVTSLTDNFINPVLNVVTGGKMYTLQDVAGFASAFLSSIVNFLIMAFVLFCILKAVNTVMDLGKKKLAAEEEAAAPSARARSLSKLPAALTVLPYWRRLRRRKLQPQRRKRFCDSKRTKVQILRPFFCPAFYSMIFRTSSRGTPSSFAISCALFPSEERRSIFFARASPSVTPDA